MAGLAALWAWGLRTPEYPLPVLAGQWHSGQVVHGGLVRRFHWYQPRELANPAPVVLLLHGSAATGERMRSATGRAFDVLADREGFIAVYPDGHEGHWNDCRVVGDYAANILGVDDTGFLRAAVARIGASVAVDEGRVHAFGLSNGGHLAFRLALEAPDFVAGVAAVAASLPTPDNQECRPSGQPVPVLVINGTGDPVSPYDGGRVTLLGSWGDRGNVQSTTATVDYFRRLAGHGPDPFLHRYPDAVPGDGTVAFRTVWSAAGRPEVALISLHGGGHTIPHPTKVFPRILGRTNQDLSAAEEAWRFFARQERRAGRPPTLVGTR